jgi:hypothetical protein
VELQYTQLTSSAVKLFSNNTSQVRKRNLMRWNNLFLIGMLATVGLGSTNGVSAQISPPMQAAISANSSESEKGIATLRQQGQAGVQAFINAYQNQLENPSNNSDWHHLNAVLDKICQQRDCYASQLYWYTDLAQAKAAAKATGKPILSLRLLGKLDEDLSCANSRFFRIVLYPNAEVSKLLRDRFILHWESVRPAPRVTIDFGGGRVLERTITGNSIHYILDSEGRIVDALPGLYGPQAFKQQLIQAETATKSSIQAGTERNNYLRNYWRDRISSLQNNWQTDLTKLGIAPPSRLMPVSSENPTAQLAANLAISKAAVERPILSAISRNQQTLSNITNEAAWNQIAQLHLTQAHLDSNTRNLMRRKNPQAYARTGSNNDPLAPVVAKFESLIALDTVRNQYLLQPQIYQWLIDSPAFDLNRFNEQVYSQLFLTPSSDPWLGLSPIDGYAGIENEGIKK